MVSALGYSCLVHITRVDDQGMSNRHAIINSIVKRWFDARLLEYCFLFICKTCETHCSLHQSLIIILKWLPDKRQILNIKKIYVNMPIKMSIY